MKLARSSTPSAPKATNLQAQRPDTKDVKPNVQKTAPTTNPTPAIDPKTGKTIAALNAEVKRKKAADFRTQQSQKNKMSENRDRRQGTVQKPPVHITKDIKPTDEVKQLAVPELGVTLPAVDPGTLAINSDGAIKAAPVDTVLFTDTPFSENLLVDLLFEDIGGQELLNLSKHDTVNGQDVVYQPIKNLGILQDTYNPTNLLKLQETSDKYFANFVVNLRDKIPLSANGEGGANYYMDDSGNIVFEFVNLKIDEQVEIQIASGGTIDEAGI